MRKTAEGVVDVGCFIMSVIIGGEGNPRGESSELYLGLREVE